ncbi:hypothetical protein P8631_19235, partial [Guyparkeria sp. 1SP6A2]|nr:hypothetical protein [Guyparkeria sp. 1SP6A2]
VLALVAHIAAYQQGEAWLDALRAYLEANLQYVADTLNAAFPTLNWQPPQAVCAGKGGNVEALGARG